MMSKHEFANKIARYSDMKADPGAIARHPIDMKLPEFNATLGTGEACYLNTMKIFNAPLFREYDNFAYLIDHSDPEYPWGIDVKSPYVEYYDRPYDIRLDQSKRYNIIFLNYDLHTNVIVIDNHKKTFERFDPWFSQYHIAVSDKMIEMNTDIPQRDSIVVGFGGRVLRWDQVDNYVNTIIREDAGMLDYKYIQPDDYYFLGPQYYAMRSSTEKYGFCYRDDKDILICEKGYCGIYSVVYALLKIRYDASLPQIVDWLLSRDVWELLEYMGMLTSYLYSWQI